MNDARRRNRFPRLQVIVCILVATSFACGDGDSSGSTSPFGSSSQDGNSTATELPRALDGTWKVVELNDEPLPAELAFDYSYTFRGDTASSKGFRRSDFGDVEGSCKGSFTLKGVTADRREATILPKFVCTGDAFCGGGGQSGCDLDDPEDAIQVRLDGDVMYMGNPSGSQTSKLVRQ